MAPTELPSMAQTTARNGSGEHQSPNAVANNLPSAPVTSSPPPDLTRNFALAQDQADPIADIRQEFYIPTRAGICHSSAENPKRDGAPSASTSSASSSSSPSIYLCGNSLGLQPKATRKYVQYFLESWEKLGVCGHFENLVRSDQQSSSNDSKARSRQDGDGGSNNDNNDSGSRLLPPWTRAEEGPRAGMAALIGARESEVAIMGSLTANLHSVLASFYRPTEQKYKIIIEEKAFPSDHYAMLSQLSIRDISPDALITISPTNSETLYFSTQDVMDTITQHADTTALVVLPGIQYFSGQLFDIEKITQHAHSLGIVIGWDLAHAVGNVDLKLHDWGVDFAVWCTYKYLNAGAGSVGGLFVHDGHGRCGSNDGAEGDAGTTSGTWINPHKIDLDPGSEGRLTADSDHNLPVLAKAHYHGQSKHPHLPRLMGWWGANSLDSRFQMDNNRYEPVPSAAGWQVSNPGVLNIAPLMGSLEVFAKVDGRARRDKSERLTEYLVTLLDHDLEKRTMWPPERADNSGGDPRRCPYEIITPRDKRERGAQISIRLRPVAEGQTNLSDYLMAVVARLRREYGIVVDERKPDVLRVAPAPLYNTFADVWDFVAAFQNVLGEF